MNILPSSKSPILAFRNHLLESVDQKLWPDYTVVVSTGRLSTFLKASLTGKAGATLLPNITTFDGYIGKLARDLLPTGNNVQISDGAATLIMQHVIGSHSSEQMIPDHGRETLLLYHNMLEHGLGLDSFDHLIQQVNDLSRRSVKAAQQIERRIEELRNVLSIFIRTLNDRHINTKAMERSSLIHQLMQLERFSDQSLAIVGVTNISPFMEPLLLRLRSEIGAQFWINKPNEQGNAGPLSRFLEKMLATDGAAAQELGASAPPDPRVHLIEAASPEQEVAMVTSAVAKLTESGMTPSRIAILSSDDQLYRPILLRHLRKHGIQSNVALPVAYRATERGDMLRCWLNLVKEPDSLWQAFAWLSLEDSFKLLSDESQSLQSASYLNYKRQLTLWLDRVIKEGLSWRGLGSLRLASASIRPLLEGAAKRLINDWQQSDSTDAWRAKLEALATASTEEPAENMPFIAPLILSALDEIVAVSGFCLGQTQSPTEFADLVIENVLNESVHPTGEPLKDVQVLSLAEARGYPFESVFILGANEGNLPSGLPTDQVLDDYLRRLLGLPGWAGFEAIEVQNFWLLVDRAPSVTLSFTHQIGNTPSVPSRFIDQLKLYGRIRSHTLVDATPAKKIADDDLEERRSAGDFGINVDRMSATLADALIACPYRFALRYLGIRDIQLAEEGSNPLLEGNRLHRILELFFTENFKEADLNWPDRSLNENEFAEIGMGRLLKLSEKILAGNASANMRYHLENFAWPKFLNHILLRLPAVARRPSSSTRKEEKLKALTPNQPVVNFANRPLYVSGSIDSIDDMPPVGTSVLTDYKRKTTPAISAVAKGVNIQLAFYMMCIEELSPAGAPLSQVAGYYSILNGEWQACIVDAQDNPDIPAGLINKKTPEWPSVKERTIKMLDWRLSEVDGGTCLPDASSCERCRYHGVCRRYDAAFATSFESTPLDDRLHPAKETP